MKKVLILAYDFPPYVSAGGLRPYSWYKYLKKFDVYPVVVTRQWGNKYGNDLDYIAPGESDQTIVEETENGRILRTPYKPNLANKIMLKYGDSKFRIFRKVISAYYEILQWFIFVGPKNNLYKEASVFLEKNEVSVIIATGDPFVLFRYASKLSKKHNIPWIADYRDTWVQDKTGVGNIVSVSFKKYLEKKYLKNSSVITTVSTFLHKHISVNINNKPFEIIINGYDELPCNMSDNSYKNNDVFTIAFAGTIYNWHPWKSFLITVSDFVKTRDKKIKLLFLGNNIRKDIESFIETDCLAIKSFVRFYPKMNNADLQSEIKKSDALLLFNDYSILGTKIFDYLAVKRKILLCFSDDSEAKKLKERFYCIEEIESENNKLQEDLISETNSGTVVKNPSHLLDSLDELYKEFEENGFIECNSVGVENYSRIKQVGKLSEIIHKLTA